MKLWQAALIYAILVWIVWWLDVEGWVLLGWYAIIDIIQALRKEE